jgi:hypothetical protein
MNFTRATFLVILLAVATPLLAQDRTVESQKDANIERLMKLLGAGDLQQNLMDRMMAMLKQSFDPAGQGDERVQKMLSRFTVLFTEEMKKVNLTGITHELYSKYFTNEDILGLISFYESPVGKKAIQMLPQIQAEGFDRGAQLGQEAAQKAIDRWAAEFPEVQKALQSQRK